MNNFGEPCSYFLERDHKPVRVGEEDNFSLGSTSERKDIFTYFKIKEGAR